MNQDSHDFDSRLDTHPANKSPDAPNAAQAEARPGVTTAQAAKDVGGPSTAGKDASGGRDAPLHTPTPWKMEPCDRGCADILGPQDEYVCDGREMRGGALSEADAALIVRAVNSHASSVAAMEAALAVFDLHPAMQGMGEAKKLRAAIALATGGQNAK